MSESKAKQIRQLKQQQPEIVSKMEIILYQDGSIEVRNFPSNLAKSLTILGRAVNGVIKYFEDKNRADIPGLYYSADPGLSTNPLPHAKKLRTDKAKADNLIVRAN